MRSRWLADAAPPVFGAVAEAAWIAVFAAAVSAPIGGPGPLGSLLPCVIAALVGVAVARLLPMGPARPVVLLGVALAFVLGAVFAGRALGVAPAVGPQPVGAYPLLGLAVLRGAAQGDPSAGASAIDTLVRRAPFLLVGGWLFGLMVSGEGRAGFVAAAASATLVLVLSAAMGLGTARLAALAPETRDQLRGNGAWLLLVAVVVGCALAVALPVSAIVGQPVGALAGGLAGLATTVLLTVAGGLMGVIVFIVDAIAGFLRGLLGIASTPPTAPPPESQPQLPVVPGSSDTSSTVPETVIAIALLAALVLLAWYLAVRWQGARRSTARASEIPERRSIVLDARGALPSMRLPRRLRSLLRPSGALEAYPRLLDDWAHADALARDPSETPAAHAARLRASGRGDQGLDLLAADYQLARFGAVRLTRAEERRAVRRWRRLRGIARGGKLR